MAGSLNKVMLIGNLGRDPEMRYSPAGEPVTSFSLAVNESYKGVDGKMVDRVEWFNITAFGKLAETCAEHLAKGQKVYVEGRLRTRSWEGADGAKHSRTEVIASQTVFLVAKQTVGEVDEAEPFGPSASRRRDAYDDGLPC